MDENLEKLLNLSKENPDLDIMPMVDCEVICSDEYNMWLGSFGDCEVKEYFIDDSHDDGCIVYIDGFDDYIEKVFWENMKDLNNKEWKDFCDNKNKEFRTEGKIEKAIFININTP